MVTIASTTSSPEELEHAVGPNWRDPAALKVPEPASPETEESAVENVAEQEAAKEQESDTHVSKAKRGTPKWAQKRIDKLTARAKEAETRISNSVPREEIDRLVNERLEQLKQEQGAPKLDENDPLIQQIIAKTRAAALEEAERVFNQREFTNRVSSKLPEGVSWDQFLSLAKEVILPVAVMDALKQQPPDVSDEVFIYLVENPEIAARLTKMVPDDATPSQVSAAVFEFGKIVHGLEKENRSPEVKKDKPKPPEPIATVGASSARSAVPLDQMDVKEFIKVRNKAERDRRL